MKKNLNAEGMLGVHYKVAPLEVLKMLDKQLLPLGFEIAYFARGEEVMWKIDKTKTGAIPQKGERVHKSGATIRSISM